MCRIDREMRRKWGLDLMGLKAAAFGGGKEEKLKVSSASTKSKMKLWMIRATTSILLWTCVVQLTALGDTWGSRVLKGWPCFNHESDGAMKVQTVQKVPVPVLPPKRVYKNNGYLMVSCNGGLNQMRSAVIIVVELDTSCFDPHVTNFFYFIQICDMVAIARYLNVTLIVPELDKTSFWSDPSEFQDIFDVDHFITSLRDEVRILKELPPRLKSRVDLGMLYTMPPISWSDISYYSNQILPLIRKYKVVHLNRTDSRLANNGQPMESVETAKFFQIHPQIEELERLSTFCEKTVHS
ncbi:hypothetical protein Leryth_006148 [Lithospermum erythrorhizon]|nr:hypothetical protein Leryth_006148 [Lithospermum erythrorhizon]